tara:strand:- start:354 stop:674 length:321 start_codon:yes stop_codon:yes gene_type:complete
VSKEDKLIPKLVKETITDLTESIKKKNEYIKLLEDRMEELEQENFYLRKNQKTEPDEEGNIVIEIEEQLPTDNVAEGLKKMGIEPEDLQELSDMLDEALGKEDDEG